MSHKSFPLDLPFVVSMIKYVFSFNSFADATISRLTFTICSCINHIITNHFYELIGQILMVLDVDNAQQRNSVDIVLCCFTKNLKFFFSFNKNFHYNFLCQLGTVVSIIIGLVYVP